MNTTELKELWIQHAQVDAIASAIKKKSGEHILARGLCGSAQALTTATLYEQLAQKKQGRTMLILLENHEQASYLQHDLETLTGHPVLLFPTTHRLRQKGQDESYTIQRTEVLTRLRKSADECAQDSQSASPQSEVVISYPEAVMEGVATQEALATNSIRLNVGQTIRESELVSQLSELGFGRVDFVYEPGQFAVRGGIVDIYSFALADPYRLDFFGDEIDSIRLFDIETQLSKSKVDHAEIVGKPLTEAGSRSESTILQYLPEKTIVLAQDFNYVLKTIEGMGMEAMSQQLQSFTTIEMGLHSYFRAHSVVDFSTQPQPIFHKNFDLLHDDIELKRSEGYRVYILSDSRKQTDRLGSILDTLRGIEVGLDGKATQEVEHLFSAVYPTLHEGFVDNDLKCCFYTDHQIFERYHKVEQKSEKARQGKVLITLKELNQLQMGDYVVHVDHGIGQFGGLVKTTLNGKPQEMIKLIYRGGDTIFVSIHSLHRISKYKGKDGGVPNVSKLGSGQWERLKERTKEKVKDIARDLIKLYAARKQEQGFSYSPDSYMQHELEASFLYEDTPDQAKATIDLKHDMESPMPMDRLICGDVGFGKTELAMRAAFKAAADGKQTAVLVPTTVLALQHYNSFSERFKDFPVRVEYLSRAKTAKQTKEILADLEAGRIDVIIGTHKLVGKTVKFKDLGLLIIDEEQKFGVAVKEKLRSLKVNVDTLTLTATPIPRTLQFSLLGARDLSIMTTPPQNRYPIQTTVITPTDEDILQEAVRLELGRNGQVFVIHNRVSTLDMVAHQIQRLCPEARIVTANGQMPPEQVEQILTDFINYDYDVLVATSIIENGVDIPNANTIIIGNAHTFGLSDLHQMRGRVGRSNRKAYCYLVAPSSELLTPEARRRLTALETFADLGSGFHLAMQDLDIRGAGNMLGAEQSGFIADLGYETYQRILNEAVMELKENEFQDLFEEAINGETGTQTHYYVNDTQLESDLEIGFPANYIQNISERITLYRELDSIQNEEALVAFKKRLIDRFGVLPEAGEELLQVVRLRWLCMRLGIEKIVLKKERLLLYFPSNQKSPYYHSATFDKVLRFVVSRPQRCQFRELPIREGSEEKRRSVQIDQVKTVNGAFTLLSKIDHEE
ncbi:MAG: transcription-repair coupling factor [Paludibacteraceae bacterium]|nr:transcription-repair coupling factor [Paludibacteraceae bacterium]